MEVTQINNAYAKSKEINNRKKTIDQAQIFLGQNIKNNILHQRRPGNILFSNSYPKDKIPPMVINYCKF